MNLIKLECAVQRYDWGKRGNDSLVARLSGTAASNEFAAELWMGAHPKAPSLVNSAGQKIALGDYLLRDAKTLLGKTAVEKFGTELPFLFKVLSIGGPLSIQAHPEKELAAQLHRRDPKKYPDENHKPEIAIAVSPLQALAGFRPLVEIAESARRVPAWRGFLPPEVATALMSEHPHEDSPESSRIRKQIAAAIVHAPREQVKSTVELILKTIDSPRFYGEPEDLWFLEGAKHFDRSDSGLLWFYLLNLITVNPGDALYVGPNIPHAYLSGDLIECMANSDNVVRAGLTHKFIDKDTLLDMLDYASSIEHIFRPEKREHQFIYRSPAQEFAVTRIAGTGSSIFESKNGAIALTLAGSADIHAGSEQYKFSSGDVYFIPAGANLSVSADRNTDIYIASIPN